MNVIKLIQFVSYTIWALPPFRQYKGKFFYYFLFVAISDPFSMLIHSYLRPVPSNISFVLALFGSLVSIISINKRIRWTLVISVLVAVLTLGFSLPNWDIAYILCVLLFLILYYSTRHIAVFALKNRYMSFFHFLFLIYNASLLIKLINAMVDPYMGAVYFYSTTIFELILGILFCFFREEDKRFALKLSKKQNSIS